MANTIKEHKLANGITLIIEEMPERVSAAFNLVVNAGSSQDPLDKSGTAAVMSELSVRGAGEYNNQQLNQALDSLGVHYNNNAGMLTSTFTGVTTNNNIEETLSIFSDIILRPHLSDEEFPNCQALAIQALESIEDDPRQKVSILSKETFLCPPLNRPTAGKIEDIQNLSCADIKKYYQDNFSPANMIISIAGGVAFEEMKSHIEKLFSNWQSDIAKPKTSATFRTGSNHHANDGSQTHISLAWPSVHMSDKNYYKAVLVSSILSGGMGSRLFTEVREKRGLCYAVGANHVTIADKGAMMAYVGSSPDNAQQALDVMVAELNKLKEGVTQDEIDRARVGLRASLIMQGESSSSRVGSLSNDYFHLKRTRTLQEIEDAINTITREDLMEYIIANPAGSFSLATIGPNEVSLPQ